MFASLQAGVVRQWMPLVKFVLHFGEAGLHAVDHFERSQRHAVGVHTFSKMAAVADQQFLEPVLSALTCEKPTVSRFMSAVVKCTKTQWFTWQIMCPSNPVHPERRMSLTHVHCAYRSL